MEDYKKLITRKHLASLLDVNPQTIVKLEKQGMPFVRIGDLPRYDYLKVVEWLTDEGDINDR